MKCWLWHKWGKWSEPFQIEATVASRWHPGKIGVEVYYVQKRKCETCGLEEVVKRWEL